MLSFIKFVSLLLATTIMFVLASPPAVDGQIVPIQGALPAARSTFNQVQSPFQAPTQNYPPPRVSQGNYPLVRIKDITTVEGHRSNRVKGYGLIYGLKGTGGKSGFTRESHRNALLKFGLQPDEVPTGSVGVVMVTAEVPAFMWKGQKINASIAVADDTSSLVGGVLVDTPLEAFDGRVYAVAGGPVNLSGFSASGAGGAVAKNHDTSGKVEAQIEAEMNTEPPFPRDKFRLLLLNKDYATAHRIANEINRYFPGSAWAGGPSRVEITFPRSMMGDKLAFVTKIGSLTVSPDVPARVVINQKTGTIVVGQNVKLSKVVFANENLVITTNETPIASQPAPFSDGQTAILPRTELTATETGGTYNQLSHSSTVGDLANILNTLGVGPRDLINIFHDLRASGALQAQLILE